MSPFLFSMVVDSVLSKARDEPKIGGVIVSGRPEPLFDMDLFAESPQYVQRMLNSVANRAAEVGLRINVAKTKNIFTCCHTLHLSSR